MYSVPFSSTVNPQMPPIGFSTPRTALPYQPGIGWSPITTSGPLMSQFANPLACGVGCGAGMFQTPFQSQFQGPVQTPFHGQFQTPFQGQLPTPFQPQATAPYGYATPYAGMPIAPEAIAYQTGWNVNPLVNPHQVPYGLRGLVNPYAFGAVNPIQTARLMPQIGFTPQFGAGDFGLRANRVGPFGAIQPCVACDAFGRPLAVAGIPTPYAGQLPFTSQIPGLYPGQYLGQIPGQIPGQYLGQIPGQIPGQYLGQIPGQYPWALQGQLLPFQTGINGGIGATGFPGVTIANGVVSPWTTSSWAHPGQFQNVGAITDPNLTAIGETFGGRLGEYGLRNRSEFEMAALGSPWQPGLSHTVPLGQAYGTGRYPLVESLNPYVAQGAVVAPIGANLAGVVA